MIKKIYVNGCSWTDGDTMVVNGLFDKLGIKERGKAYSYPKLLANHYNLILNDDSRYGGSLNRVTRKTWRYLQLQKNISEIIFLIEIPNGTRDEIFCVDNNDYLNITPSDLDITDDIRKENVYWDRNKKKIIEYYENFWDYDEFNLKQWIDFMCLILFIKQHTDNIFLINYSHFINGKPRSPIDFEKISLSSKNFIDIIHPETGKKYDLIEHMCDEEKISIGDILGVIDTHPNIEGHQVLFKIISDHFSRWINKGQFQKLL